MAASEFGSDAIKVFVRFRPQNSSEIARDGGGSVVKFNGSSCTLGNNAVNSAAGLSTEHSFAFDGVFAPDSGQADVYERVGRPLVNGLFGGYNGALLAYGQTGSGKTFSMAGPSGSSLGAIGQGSDVLDPAAGIIPRCVADIFATALAAPEDCEFSIKASYVEIYQERVRDLLVPQPAAGALPSAAMAASENLAIGEEPSRGIYVKGAREEYVSSPTELLALMAAGNANRATAATGMNAGSSRSHAIFTIALSSHDASSGITARSKLLLCDLAGSETVSKTGVSGQQLEELKKINKSLSALGLVVHALTESGAGGGPRSHVPYRDSKLTRLLQECLGGNSRTALLCAASPSAWNAVETLSTLRFGARAKRVKNAAKAQRERTPEETAKHADACEGALVALDAAAVAALSALEAAVLALPQDHAAFAGGTTDSPLAAVGALLDARRHAASVMCASTDPAISTAASALVASGGSGPPLGGRTATASATAAPGPAPMSETASSAPIESAPSQDSFSQPYISSANTELASGGSAQTSDDEASRLRAEVSSLTSQLTDMVELLTEAGCEVGALQARVAELEVAAAESRGGLGQSGDSAGLGASAHSVNLRDAFAAASLNEVPVSPPADSQTPADVSPAASASLAVELSMLRAELEQSTSESHELRTELLDAKARVSELEDALMQLATPESGGDSSGEGAGAMPAQSAPASGASPPPSATSSGRDGALACLSAELASRNETIARYEGRLTTLFDRIARAVETGDVRHLETGSVDTAAAAGGRRRGSDEAGSGVDGAGVPKGGTPVKSIRGRGGHARPGGAAFTPPRYGHAHQTNGSQGRTADGTLDATGSPAEGLLSRLWRKVTAGVVPPGGPMVPPPTHRAIHFTTSADLHILSPARAIPRPAGAPVAAVTTRQTVAEPGPVVAVQPSAPQGGSLTSRLAVACEAGDLAAVQAVLSAPGGPGAACLPDDGGRTAVMHACRGGHAPALALLVGICGAGLLEAVDRDGRSPLHYASRRGHAGVVSWLLQQGASPTQADSHGLTPLHMAALARSAPVARLLLEAGADPLAVDLHGATPYAAIARITGADAQAPSTGAGKSESEANDRMGPIMGAQAGAALLALLDDAGIA